MSQIRPIALEPAPREVGAATARPVGPPAADRAHPRPAHRRLVGRRDRSLGELLMLIGLVAVAGPPAVAVAAALALLALALAGPFLLLAILVAAFVLVALIAVGTAG